MTRSDSINELATALAKAQGEIEGAKKDAENPFFKSKYADLAAVREAIQMPLSKNGLSYVQPLRSIQAADGLWCVECETVLMHTSGQWIAETLMLPTVKSDPQGIGSASTYARRYGLMGMVGVAAEDDDGNASSFSGAVKSRPNMPERPTYEKTVKVLAITYAIEAGRSNVINTRYKIACDDKQVYWTFQKSQADSAKAAQEARLSVKIVYRLEQGNALVSIAELDAVEPPA